MYVAAGCSWLCCAFFLFFWAVDFARLIFKLRGQLPPKPNDKRWVIVSGVFVATLLVAALVG